MHGTMNINISLYVLEFNMLKSVIVLVQHIATCLTVADYPLSYRVPVRERYGSTLLPATREQHDQNCTQSH